MTAFDRVRVLIATTQGPVEVEAIFDLEAGESSIVALGSSADVVDGMIEPYRNFVAKGSGVVARAFGHDAFRLELSGEIHIGESWQLAVFLAHALHKAGRLAQAGEPASFVVWATGQVDYHLRVAEIGHVPEKITGALGRLRAERAAGHTVHAVWPKANEDHADASLRERLANLGIVVQEAERVSHVLAALNLPLVEAANTADPAWTAAPYRGLAAFGETERAIFFGRGRAREEAIERLRTAASRDTAFLLVHGSSGAGKSSLARAGLLGDIVNLSDVAQSWRSAVLPPVGPGRSPLTALAEALFAALPSIRMQAGLDLAALMVEAPAEATARIVAALDDDEARRHAKLALLVDQLEDVLLWGAAEVEGGDNDAPAREREAFATMLERLARSGSVWVLCTLRTDFLPRLEDLRALSQLASDSRLYRLERPSRGALREMILGPARLVNLTFEGDDAAGTPLAEALVDAAAGSPDSLPLLQFGLARLYELRDQRSGAITADAYRRIGGIEGAIGRYAEERTAGRFGADEAMVRAVDHLILALARPGADGGTMVARTLLLDPASQGDPLRQALAALTEARLVTIDVTRSGEGSARVTHEALLTHWPRAQRLLDEQRAALDLRERLEEEARAWDERGRDGSFLLQAGRALDAAQGLVDEGRIGLSARARSFVTTSADQARSLADQRRLALEAEQARRLEEAERLAEANRRIARRTLVGLAAALVLALAAGGFGVAAYWLKTVADRNALEARAQTQAAETARKEAEAQRTRTEKTLNAAGQTAITLVYDVAVKFRTVAGMPANVIAAVLDQAIALQERLITGGDDDILLKPSLANALAVASQTQLTLGRVSDAVRTAQKSYDISSELIKLRPTSQKYGFVISAMSLGDALLKAGEPSRAATVYRSAIETAHASDARDAELQRLEAASLDRIGLAHAPDAHASDARNAELQRLEAAALNRLGLIERDAGETEAALGDFAKASSLGRDYAKGRKKDDPIAQRDLLVDLDLLGSTTLEMGNVVRAQEAFSESLAIAQTLASKDQSDVQAQQDLAQSLTRLGQVARRTGDRTTALKLYEEGLQILERLVALDASNMDFQLDVANELAEIGDTQVENRNSAGARAAYERCLAISRKLGALDKGNYPAQRKVAVMLQAIGDISRTAENWVDALRTYEDSLAIVRTLAADQGHPEAQKDLAATLGVIAGLREKTSDTKGAFNARHEEIDIQRRFAASKPNDAKAQRALADSLERLCDLAINNTMTAQANETCGEAIALRRKLIGTAAGLIEDQAEIAWSLIKMATAEALQGDQPAALRLVDQSLASIRSLRASHPDDASVTEAFLGIFGKATWRYLRAKDNELTLALAKEGLRVDASDLTLASNEAHALMFLGRNDEARDLYLGHRGTRAANGQGWESMVLGDFAIFDRVGLSAPLMDEIRADFAKP